jgi:hypothetical protein
MLTVGAESHRLTHGKQTIRTPRRVGSGAFAIGEVGLSAALIKPLLQDWYVKRAKYRRRGTSIEAYIEAVTAFIDGAVSAKAHSPGGLCREDRPGSAGVSSDQQGGGNGPQPEREERRTRRPSPGVHGGSRLSQ